MPAAPRCGSQPRCGGRGDHRAGVLEPAGAGARVRAAGIHHDPRNRPLASSASRHEDGCRPKAVRRERRRGGARAVGGDDHEVGAARLADAGLADADREAGGGDEGHAHGWSPTPVSPAVSSRPSATFMFWTACPAAPLPRLSIADTTTARRSPTRRAWTKAWFEPVVCFVAGGASLTWTKGSPSYASCRIFAKALVVEVVAQATGSRSRGCHATAERGAGRT